MSQTQFVSAAMAAELFQTMGVEITIFAVSITLAAMFRGAPFGKQIGGCQQAFADPQSKPSQANSCRNGSPGSKKPVRSWAEQQAIDRYNAARSGTSPRSAMTQKIDTMHSLATRRYCAEAMAMYRDMRSSGDHKAIKDLPKRSKKGPADVFASLVQCAGNLGQLELVEDLLDDMMALSIDRSLAFYESTMKMLAAKKCYKGALSVCTRLEADGFEPSPTTLSCLISFAHEVGETDRAISFFNRLTACSTPHVRACMTILRVYSKRQEWTKSLQLLRDMQRTEAAIDSLVLNIVLSTGVAARQLEPTKALLKEFAQIADTVSYNTVLKGLAQQKDAGQALILLDEMGKTGVKPNSITFNTTIDAAVRSRRDADAWRVLAQMIDTGFSPDKFTCTSLMKGLQNGATSEQLTVILDLLKNVTIDNNRNSYSFLFFRSVIEAAAAVNDPALTAKAISQMREQRVMLSTQEYQRLLRLLMREE